MNFADSARPIYFQGEIDLAVLLIHGFTSTPGSLADWAKGLHSAGTTVSVPLLPGHGTSWEDLNRVSWKDWEAVLLQSWDGLAERHRRVAVGGLSLGGALAVLVAAKRPKTAALLLVNHLMWLGDPAFFLAPVVKFLIASLPPISGDIKKPGVAEPAYDRVPVGGIDQLRLLLKKVRPLLATLKSPALVFKSREDHVVPAISATRTFARLGSSRKELVWLENSYHVATMDNDLPIIVERSIRFLKEAAGFPG